MRICTVYFVPRHVNLRRQLVAPRRLHLYVVYDDSWLWNFFERFLNCFFVQNKPWLYPNVFPHFKVHAAGVLRTKESAMLPHDRHSVSRKWKITSNLLLWFDFLQTRIKKTSLGESLAGSHAYRAEKLFTRTPHRSHIKCICECQLFSRSVLCDRISCLD